MRLRVKESRVSVGMRAMKFSLTLMCLSVTSVASAECGNLMLCTSYDFNVPVTISNSSAGPALTVMGGNVGFGTATPGSALDVVGTIRADTICDRNGANCKTVTDGWGASGTSLFANGGNSFGAATSLGTNDSFDLSLLSAGSVAMTVKPDGKIGVGTTSPSSKFTVAGIIESTMGGIKFPDGSIQTTAGGAGASQWSTSGSDLYYVNGNIGVGKTNPARLLDVNGPIRVAPAPLPSPAAAGDLAIDSNDLNRLKFYNGTSWVGAFGIKGVNGGAGITVSPVAANGTVVVGMGNTTVSPGTYGSANQIPTFTVDALGRLTAAGNVSISGASPLGASLAAGKIWVGSSSNVATEVAVTGDATLSSSGAFTLSTVPVSKGGTGATSFGANKIVSTNGTGTSLTSFSCSSGQVIKFDASGFAGCANDEVGSATGTVTSIAAGTGLTGGTITSSGTIGLANTAVTPGTYGSATQVAQFTVDAQGRITSASNVSVSAGGSTQWTTTGSDISYTTGKVGIGTASPTAALEVAGDVKINGLTVGRGGSNNSLNTAVGYGALLGNSSGVGNTAVGWGASSMVQTESFNTIVGYNAGSGYGGGNTAVGAWALNNSQTGYANIAIGRNSLADLTTGGGNIAVGVTAGWGLTTGTSNILIGTAGGPGVTNGSYNVIIGSYISGIPSGLYNNIILADGQGHQRINVNDTGNVGIGVTDATTKLQVAGLITPAADATYDLGASALRFVNVYAQNGTIQTSDLREKKDIHNTDLGLNFINKLRPVSFRWKNNNDQGVHYGLIAQEAAKAIQESKAEMGADDRDQDIIVSREKKSDRFGLRYSELIAPIIKAIQEMAHSDRVAHEEITSLKTENADLKKRIEKLERMLKN